MNQVKPTGLLHQQEDEKERWGPKIEKESHNHFRTPLFHEIGTGASVSRVLAVGGDVRKLCLLASLLIIYS